MLYDAKKDKKGPIPTFGNGPAFYPPRALWAPCSMRIWRDSNVPCGSLALLLLRGPHKAGARVQNLAVQKQAS